MSKEKKSINPYYYKDIAKQLGVRHLFGRWGVQLNEGLEKKHLRLRIIPLDGWVLQQKDVVDAMEKRGLEL